ncbi:PfkB family carbohydrate kinase [Arthrobacter dokdonensis]|uniref:PfkB family carbohydrate kinase n=1 Tax=Arthrobacter dokdonellae TaxID=2211210 RepID=UPI001494EECD|nr:PfkB family carbohydrate kinase [Arthrobacter dokdonellae]
MGDTVSGTGRVFVVGSINVDTVIRVKAHPRPGESVHARGQVTAPGGKGGNQAAAAARAGAPTQMLGRIGSDALGRTYRAHLDMIGVDTTLVAASAGDTGQATIMVDDAGENSIIVLEGANGTVTEHDIALMAPLMRAGDVLTTQYELPTPIVKAALQAARAAGAFTILNPSPWRDNPELIELADLVVVNTLEAEHLGRTGDGICLTLGAGGACWDNVHVPAPKITPVDTTGAGDAFTGTLAAGIAAGTDKRVLLGRAVAAASDVCLRPNAQDWATRP